MPLTGTLTVSRIHGNGISAVVSPTCTVYLTVADGTATPDVPNQSCYSSTSDSVTTFAFNSFVLSDEGDHVLTFTADVDATGVSSGTPPSTIHCHQTQSAMLTKLRK